MRTTGTTETQSGVDRIRTDFLVENQEATTRRIEAASREGIDHTNRDAFGLRLQQQYHQYAVKEIPFLLIAMRGDSLAAPPLDFSLFYECVGKLLTQQDDWLVDFQDQRLIVLLAQSLPEVARRFFARLKIRLFEAAPQQAQAYLHTVSAIVVPNGESFQNAEDFLAVALEEE